MIKRIFFFILSTFSWLCFATISIEAELSFDCDEKTQNLKILLTNSGDESADNIEVQPLKSLNLGDSIHFGCLRSKEKFGKLLTLSEADSKSFKADSSCCAYPFILRYSDRHGNKYSSTLLASCNNETHSVDSTTILLSTACVESDSSRSVLAITAMYDYEELLAKDAEYLCFSYYLPDGITPASSGEKQEKTIPLDKSGFYEFNVELKSNIKNMKGDIPYCVIAQLLDSNGKAISIPTGVREFIHIDSALDLNAFPQNLSRYVFVFTALIILAVLILKSVKPELIKHLPERALCSIEWLTIVGLTIYLGAILQTPLALKGYTCMGGDLPAHHYLVEQICNTCSPVSWADGWWCGFPMFHYYFPLPYTCIALLSKVFSHNVAFNIGVCLGMLLLPLSVYLSARLVRMPRPLPILAVCFVIPLLLDNTHNMWGVNAYSTLAGMVANSWSFCLLLPALANICRDTQDNKFRLRTPLLIAAVALSHFFTSIVLALVVGVFWIIVCAYSYKNKTTHYRIAIIEGGLAILLVSWWLIPLAMTGEWAVAFGSQWEISFFKQLPNIVQYFFPLVVLLALSVRIFTRAKIGFQFWAWFAVFILLFLISLVLFYFGRSIGEVFVNCRLWPFIVFALLFIMAGLLAYSFRAIPICGLIFTLALCFTFAWNDKQDDKNEVWSYLNLVPIWAKHNFLGFENAPNGKAGQELIEYLRNVPPHGRIAYDLNPFNESLGSTRFFEALPALTDHPIIEGGIVNSALGSLSAYVVQGEMSEHTAGAPLLVQPQSFDPEKGLAHLELLGVRRFIAHSKSTINALDSSFGIWQKERVIGGGKWIIYKHRRESNGLVRKWNIPINFYVSDNFQKDSLEWMYVGAAVREPFALLKSDVVQSTLTGVDSRLEELRDHPTPVGDWISDLSDDIPSNIIKNGSRYEIHFKAKELNSPYIVAMSYFPNWKVKGADGPYFVTPGFMVVYPTQEDVCVYYGYSIANIIGYVISIIGCTILVIVLVIRTIKKCA